MSDERRYSEDEVRRIFEVASESSESSESSPGTRPGSEGLTLAQLQDIGREVGLPPERIAETAASLAVRREGSAPRGRYLGIPVAVGRSIELARAPTDDEWGMLVAELRRTFRARGRVESVGSLRSWTNGNLQVSIEPTESGHRLRMHTTKGNGVARITLGLGGSAVAAMMAGAAAMTGQLAEGVSGPIMLGTLSLAALGSALATLPRWAREREAQMEHIAARAKALLGRPND